MQDLYERVIRGKYLFRTADGRRYKLNELWDMSVFNERKEVVDLTDLLNTTAADIVSLNKDGFKDVQTVNRLCDKVTLLNHIINVKLKEEAARIADNERALVIEELQREPEKHSEDVLAALDNLYLVYGQSKQSAQAPFSIEE